jgi:integrase/recombinase XerD
MSKAIIPQNKQHLANSGLDAHALENALNLLLYGLSETSKRQYQHTLDSWANFCEEHGLSYADMSAVNLIAFLETEGLSRSTRQNRLSHMRKFLQTLLAAYPDDTRIKSMFEQARLLKIQTGSEERQQQHAKNTLKPMQVLEAFALWSEDSKLHARNRALLAVLLYGGLRRSEAVVLKWGDIDFDNESISVRHGKGDKARTVPFLGNIADYLKEWREIAGDRVFVFCGFRKGDHLAKDVPMKDQRVYELLRETGDKLGIDFLSPHDMRRTLLTAALANGASVADMQFIAGHARPETTLGYAKVKDAKEVQGRVKNKLPY